MKRKILLSINLTILLISLVVICFYMPRIELKGTKKVTITLGSEYKEEGYKAYFAFGTINDEVEVKGIIDKDKPGIYELTYTLAKNHFTYKTKRLVEVIDSSKPVISLVGNPEVYICPKTTYIEEGYNAIDDYDGDITNQVEIIKGNNIIKYKVKDSSNNVTIKTRKIIDKDIAAPTITLRGNSVIYLVQNSTYNEEGYKAVDNCEGDITDRVIVTNNIDTTKIGKYSVTYEVSDNSQNKVSVTREVIVREDLPVNEAIPGSIYLTFDDGPSKTITPYVLDILKEEGIKATFFVINHSSSLDYLIKRASTEGHTIGLHSYSHQYYNIYQSVTSYFNDLEAINNKVKSITGKKSNVIRFPGGSSNTISARYSKGIMSILANETINRGYFVYDWNIDSNDTNKSLSSTAIYKNVVNHLNPNGANIVLMHDFENNYDSLNALKSIISYGKENGYRFLPITSKTKMVRHKVAN